MQYITYTLIGLNLIFSIIAFNNFSLFERYKFNVGAVLHKRQWERIISSGFLHVDFIHLAFNMMALYSIGSFLEMVFRYPVLKERLLDFDGHLGRPEWVGYAEYLAIYFGAMILGDLFALASFRNSPSYSAVGASGAISGIIFCFIVLFPDQQITFFFLIPMPAWLFGLLYVAYSIFGVSSRFGNVGHEAHLGGGIGGMLIMLAFESWSIVGHWWIILVLLVPVITLIIIMTYFPHILPGNASYGGSGRSFKVIHPDKKSKNRRDEKITSMRHPHKELEQEMNALLDKIDRFGKDGLSREERERLDRISQILRGGEASAEEGKQPSDT